MTDEMMRGGNAKTRWIRHMADDAKGYEIVDFARLPGVGCPCGTARRAFAEVTDFPGTVHVTEISIDARLHYHKTLTETYYFLECDDGARMQLDDALIPVHPGMCVLIRPGVRHRAVGQMKVLIFVLPKFDPTDEWFD
jgi:mannose-6-phosphate isomerase-like protein (cupin superfamily)